MSLPKGDEVQTQAQSAGGAPSAVPDPCPSGDVPKEGSRDIQQKGKIISVPHDWCKSTDSPVPYKIWAWQSSSSNLANTVRQTDCGSHVLGSTVNQCYGDEPGTGGGVKSGTNLAECTPLSASPTVRAQDRPMVRYLDKWWMNHKNTWGCLNNSEDMGTYGAPKVQKIDAKLSPNPSREEDLQALASGTQVAQAEPAPAPAPEPPPPAPAPPASSGGNVMPFTGTTTDGPIYEAPSNPIRATSPTGSAAPSGSNFFRDYSAVPNDNGGYSYFTNLPAPLDSVYTFGQYGVEMAPGKQFYHINSNDGHPWVSADELNKLYQQLKLKQDSILRVTRPQGKRILCHYTTAAGQAGILASQQILPSLLANNPKDARLGDGQYFSDIQPGTKSNTDLSTAFLGFPFQGRRFTHYVCIDTQGLDLIQSPDRPHVFVVPNSGPLSITGRLQGAGVN